MRAKTRKLRRKLGTIKVNELKSHKSKSGKSTSIIASLNLRLADAAHYLNEQMFEQMSAPPVQISASDPVYRVDIDF